MVSVGSAESMKPQSQSCGFNAIAVIVRVVDIVCKLGWYRWYAIISGCSKSKRATGVSNVFGRSTE